MTQSKGLLAFPTTPATSASDPNVPLAAGLVIAHRAMLALYDVPEDWLSTPSELVRLSMMILHWKSVTGLGAHFHDPHRSILKRPGRAAFVEALRAYDAKAIYDAYRACCEYDGLAEIEDAWKSTVTAFGTQEEPR